MPTSRGTASIEFTSADTELSRTAEVRWLPLAVLLRSFPSISCRGRQATILWNPLLISVSLIILISVAIVVAKTTTTVVWWTTVRLLVEELVRRGGQTLTLLLSLCETCNE